MGAVHEIIGMLTAAIVGVVIVSSLSKNAQTGTVINQSFAGFNNMLGQISLPVRG